MQHDQLDAIYKATKPDHLICISRMKALAMTGGQLAPGAKKARS
jgi:hypothetical protein